MLQWSMEAIQIVVGRRQEVVEAQQEGWSIAEARDGL